MILSADNWEIYWHVLQSAEDYELKEKSVGSVHSMLRLEEPGLTHRTASIATVLTAAAMEGTVQIELKTQHW